MTARVNTKVLSVSPHDPEPEVIGYAAEVLRAAGLVVVPTDTVYGLVCDPWHAAAVDRLYEVKQRSRDLPLVLLLYDMAQVESFIEEIPEAAVRAMQEFWPGALTVVLRDCSPATEPLRACKETIGLRLPAHLVPRAVAERMGGALASSSANISGGSSPFTCQQAVDQLGGVVELALDAGPTRFAHESTVVDFTVSPPRLLRAGAISTTRLREVLGEVQENQPEP